MIEVNYLAVLMAGMASMVLGFVWYSPALFGKPWMKLVGLTAESLRNKQKEMVKLYGLSFVLALLTAYILSHVMTMSMNTFREPKFSTGLTSAFWMWLGFIMPVQTADMIFGAKKWKLLAINTGFQLVSLLAMGVVLGLL